MKQTLIGILTISCVLSAPSWNKFDNFQNLQLEIGQPAEAAPRFRMPSWVGQVLRGVGKKALMIVTSLPLLVTVEVVILTSILLLILAIALRSIPFNPTQIV